MILSRHDQNGIADSEAGRRYSVQADQLTPDLCHKNVQSEERT
jgi:hypothetical protein